MRRGFILFSTLLVAGGVFFIFYARSSPVIVADPLITFEGKPSAATATSAAPVPETKPLPALPLSDPPAVVQGIYLTGWTAGSSHLDRIIESLPRTGTNAVVIDIKDYSGNVSYAMDVKAVKDAGADKQLRIADIASVLRRLHDRNIYVIGRVTVFQDPVFSAARPDLGVKSKATGKLWRDHKGIAWLDPEGRDTWDYVIGIARDAFSRGFDEINFDYIRFPSDGNLSDISYPFFDPKIKTREQAIADFFAYLRKELAGKKISADLFGLSALVHDDLGIGQVIENAYRYFDYVSPMVYPSHYAPGSGGFKNPAEHPYDIVSQSMASALARRTALQAEVGATTTLAKLRPWLQAFDLGARYTPAMVGAQISAVAGTIGKAEEADGGYLMWDPRNTYTDYDAYKEAPQSASR